MKVYVMVAGCDEEGETISPHITLAELQAKVTWVTLEELCEEFAK